MSATTLAERQAAFMRAILDEGAPMPEGWGNSQAAGMGVYRGNYRSALMDALASTFERTARYVGENAFKRASAHHAISHPPSGWTIDEAGAGFDMTCAELFGENPEVAELAWLEWTMLQVSTAGDVSPLDPIGFGTLTADFGDEDWMGLKFDFQPRATATVVEYDLTGLWSALEHDGPDLPPLRLPAPRGCVVSREGERPAFMLVDLDRANAFTAMQAGASYGEIIALLAGDDAGEDEVQRAAMRAGEMLGEWLQEKLIIGLKA
ncbi:DNA-binding domain-containing protein [Erythrobacter sp. JK5]|uniref:HvfC/BufC N-terminal domain-containing protein n=1 Tax=Erythrobacter sp. JK5 TaxID=2829500 RepID=UPI001BA6E272|nr:DNA-binding domain-containing protein [Erythrobacter sp. JK5]QUL37772.1 putative DNA-binding domain-containing protein [Erythrobacter sp. JK5]